VSGEQAGVSKSTSVQGNPAPACELTPERWQQIKELFAAAQDHDPTARPSFLVAVCADPLLRAEVESLLSAAEGESSAANLSGESTNSSAIERPDPIIGQRMGAYEVRKRIGRGGMATVYLASRADQEYKKQVAIKMLRPELDSDELLNRFRSERQTLAALDHPNIVKLLDGGSTREGMPYLVMDYVEGVTIDEYCDQQKLPTESRLRLFHQVCLAVQYAHEKHVIHRDLKPSNILVTAQGIPKLLDFGIAKVLEPSEESQSLVTQTWTRRMTPAYASPEQVKAQAVSTTTDVYSLGVVLYELLTGHRPYKLKQHTPAEIEHAICEEDPEKPSTAIDRVEIIISDDGTRVTKTPETVSQTRDGHPDKLRRRLRGDLDRILLMALQKEPQRRYASARDFADDIERHLNLLPIRAHSNRFGYRATKWTRRHKNEVIAAALVLPVVLSVYVFSSWRARRAAENGESQRSLGRPSLAVLGFQNLAGRPDTTWLSSALSEMLTTELSASGKLRIVPGEEVAHAKADLSLPDAGSLSKTTLRSIRNSLGSDFVVLGSYLADGDANRNIRVDLRLQDVRRGETVAAVTESGIEARLSDLVARAGSDLRQRLGIPPLTAAESASAQALESQNPQALRLYQEGLSKLRAFDAFGASELLQKALALDSSFTLAHAALADAWLKLGYDVRARDEARKAFEASRNLAREQSLWIEGRYDEITGDSEKAADVFHTLFTFFPDNLDYGLHLAEAQIELRKPDQSLETIRVLRKLEPPVGRDPRIDLTEASAAQRREDYKHELEMGVQAEQRAQAQESRLLVAEALGYEAHATRLLGDLQKSIAFSVRAAQIFAAAGDRFGEARSLKTIGDASVTANDLAGAEKAFQRALEINHQLGNKVAEALSLQGMAGVHLFQRDLPRAVDEYHRAIALRQEMGKPTTIQVNNLGLAEKDLGHLAAATRNFETILPVARQNNDKGLIAACLINLAQVAKSQGNLRKAKQLAKESVDERRQAGSKPRLGEVLVEAGDVMMTSGDIAGAKKFYSEAADIFSTAKQEFNLSAAESGLADVLLAQDDVSGARKKYEKVLAVQQKQQGSPRDLFDSWIELANAALEEGHGGEAEKMVREAISVYTAPNEPQARIEGDSILIRSLIAQKKLADARPVVASDEQLMSASEDWMNRLSADVARAQFLAASGNFGKSIELLQASIEKCRKSGFGRQELEARLALGQTEMQAGRYAAARSHLRDLERDANAKGFLLIAHKAGAIAKQHKSQPNPQTDPRRE
jgi:eukaryotic-like serine/threonine-protein kinase